MGEDKHHPGESGTKTHPQTCGGITRQWRADKSPLDEGHLGPCCSLESSGEENGPHGRTLASGAAGLVRPCRPEPPPGPFPGHSEGRITLLTLPPPPHTHPPSPAGPFPHLLFPLSEKNLVPEPAESVPSPLPLPCRCPPPAISTATTSVPLNRFLLHVNIYYRFSDRGEKNPACEFWAVAPGTKLPSSARSLLPPCSTAGRSTAQRQGIAAWTADRDLLDLWIPWGPSGPALRKTRGDLTPAEHAPKGGFAVGLTGCPHCGSGTTQSSPFLLTTTAALS
nr:uncharacterized protein LOC116283070 [Vicugna pacos]